MRVKLLVYWGVDSPESDGGVWRRIARRRIFHRRVEGGGLRFESPGSIDALC